MTCNFKFFKKLLNLQNLYILIKSPKPICRIISFLKNVIFFTNKYFFKILNPLLILMVFCISTKWWKFIIKKPLVTSLIFISKSQNNWKKIMTQYQKVAYMIKSMMGVLVINTTYDYMIMQSNQTCHFHHMLFIYFSHIQHYYTCICHPVFTDHDFDMFD